MDRTWSDSFLEKWGHVFDVSWPIGWGFGIFGNQRFEHDVKAQVLDQAVTENHVCLLRYYDADGPDRDALMIQAAREIVEFAEDAGRDISLGLASVEEAGPRTVRYHDGTDHTYEYPVFSLDGHTFNHCGEPEIWLVGEDRTRTPYSWLSCIMKWELVDGWREVDG